MLKSALRLTATGLVATIAFACAGDVTAPAATIAAVSSVASAVGGSGGGGVVLSVSPRAESMPVGRTLQLTSALTNPAGHDVPSSRPVSWSSSDPRVATVSSTGEVTAVQPGRATITASTANQSASAEITVVRASPTATVYVFVFEEDGSRARNATVTLLYLGGPAARGQTDDNGVVRFLNQPVDSRCIVIAESSDGRRRGTFETAGFVGGDNEVAVFLGRP